MLNGIIQVFVPGGRGGDGVSVLIGKNEAKPDENNSTS